MSRRAGRAPSGSTSQSAVWWRVPSASRVVTPTTSRVPSGESTGSKGPTAFTFVAADGGDVALAAKALAQFRRETELLDFKGGVMGG